MESHYGQMNSYGYNGQKMHSNAFAQAYRRKYKNNPSANMTSSHMPSTNMQEQLPSSQQVLQEKYQKQLYEDSPHFTSNNQIKQEVNDLSEMIKQLMNTHLNNDSSSKEYMTNKTALSTTDILLIVIIVILFIAFIFIPLLGGIVASQMQRNGKLHFEPAKITINDHNKI